MISSTSAAGLPGLVRAALAGRSGTRWVGLDGLGASGKTTMAAELAAVLPGAVVVHIDDFAHPDVLGWQRQRFVEEVLAPLLAGRSARYRVADLLSGRPGAWVEVPTGVPVVVEGVSATDVRVPVPWDLTVWLEVAEAERHRRIRARDPAVLLERWRTAWWPQEEAYVRAQRPAERVDVVVRAGPDDGPGGRSAPGFGPTLTP